MERIYIYTINNYTIFVLKNPIYQKKSFRWAYFQILSKEAPACDIRFCNYHGITNQLDI